MNNNNDNQQTINDDSSLSSDDDVVVAALVVQAAVALEEEQQQALTADADHRRAVALDRIRSFDMRSLGIRVKKRRVFDHAGALHCINRDFLGPEALFLDDFEDYFRVSRSRFEQIMQHVGNAGFAFYKPECATGRPLSTMQARLMLPLKTLSYGVAMHTFCDYFQMSRNLAIECCRNFDLSITSLFQEEWMRCPTKDDMTALVNLHQHVHGVPGMLGSLDCSQTFWKNCPKGWHGTYKTGKEKKPSIVLEAICDYHCFFWHSTYGYAGSLNDDNVMYLSPFLQKLIDGSFGNLEDHLVPFEIAGQLFDQKFLLTDGVYSLFSRFVKPIKQPMTRMEKRYTKWQESARKSIERAFGILKERFQWVDRPIQLIDLKEISLRMNTCIILHNMCVSERIMQSVDLMYKPDFDIQNLRQHETIQPPPDYNAFVHAVPHGNGAVIGNNTLSDEAREWILTREMNWNRLVNKDEYYRLHFALMDFHNSGHNDGHEPLPPSEM